MSRPVTFKRSALADVERRCVYRAAYRMQSAAIFNSSAPGSVFHRFKCVYPVKILRLNLKVLAAFESLRRCLKTLQLSVMKTCRSQQNVLADVPNKK